MWRILRLAVSNYKVSAKHHLRQYSTSTTSHGTGKVFFGIIASTGLGFAGAIVYGRYDPKFKSLIENIPYVNNLYDLFPDDKSNAAKTSEDDLLKRKGKDIDSVTSPSLLKKKSDRDRASIIEVPKPPIETKPKSSESILVKDDKHVDETNLKKSEYRPTEHIFQSSAIKEDFASNENALNETIKNLRKSCEDTLNIQKITANAVKLHTEKLYEALDLSESKNNDRLWRETKEASLEKEKLLKLAKQKATETKNLIAKVKNDAKKLSEHDPNNPLVKNGEDIASKCLEEIERVQLQVEAAEKEAKTADDYEQLVKDSKKQFEKELQIVLPNYLHGDKDKTVTEGDLNLLIAHAHRRIEQLQKQIAKQQVTEKMRVDEAIRNQRLQDEQLTESKIETEMKKRHLDLETAVESRVASLKSNFEAELHQQLLRQAAAHADHLQEVLKMQEQELERKHVLEVEEKLLHQKGIFVSEISGNVARLKGMTEYLKAKNEFDNSSKKAQALWLACQALNSRITLDKSGNVGPLAKDVAALRIVADEENTFVNCILSGIPSEALNRGVFTNENLKERFEKVKSICRKVAAIDEKNDSLFRYFLSYIQSFLIIDRMSIPHDELEGKVSVDSAALDTFEIVARISHCLKKDDLEQALRYANQLKGEPRIIANDWRKEVQLLLETELAVKALLAHAAAVGVQAYH